MSTSQSFPGATYTFCLGNGESGALFPASHIQTSRGRVDLPGEDVLALQGTVYNGTLLMAGQGHQTGQCWFWNGAWRSLGLTFGVRPCAFGPDVLIFSTSGHTYEQMDLATGVLTAHEMQIGSQGIRYVNEQNQPVTGDQTIYDGHIHEWIERGGVRLGQGHTGGAILNGHVVEPGDCQFMTFDKQGDAIGIGIVKFPEGRAVTHILTVSEIVNLPLPTAPVVPPVQPPVPPIQPPAPEPKPMSVPDKSAFAASFLGPRLALLGSEDETRAHSFAAVNAGCIDLRKDDARWGLLEKTGGDRVRDRATDIWLYNLGDGTAQVVDVVGNAEGSGGTAPTPGWSVKDIRPMSQWREPYADVPNPGTIPPNPGTPPPVPAVDLGPLKAQIADLQEQNAANGRRTDALEAVIAALTVQVQAPKQYRVVGSTGRTYGHAHSVNVTLEEIQL